MKFKKFLNEKVQKELIEEFKNLLSTDYSEAYKKWKAEIYLFRGTSSIKMKTFKVFQPIKNRKSVNILNLYNPIINEHPSWNKFPDRNVICANDDWTTENFGKSYYIFPKNGTLLGFCDGEDIWHCFDIPYEIFEGMEDFSSTLAEMIKPNIKKQDKWEMNPLNLKELKDFCGVIEKRYFESKWNRKKSNDIKSNEKEMTKNVWEKFNEAFYEYLVEKKMSLFDVFIKKIFRVNKLFNTTEIKNFKKNDKICEVWFDSEYLLIDRTFMETYDEI